MIVSRDVQDLILAAAPHANLAVVDFYEDKKTWHIAADSETELFGELDEKRNVLVLSQPLGMAAELGEALLSLALRFSHVWDANGGTRLTLEGETGPFWLVMDVGLGSLKVEQLASIFRTCVAKGAAWRDILRDPLGGKEDSLGARASDGFMRA